MRNLAPCPTPLRFPLSIALVVLRTLRRGDRRRRRPASTPHGARQQPTAGPPNARRGASIDQHSLTAPLPRTSTCPVATVYPRVRLPTPPAAAQAFFAGPRDQQANAGRPGGPGGPSVGPVRPGLVPRASAGRQSSTTRQHLNMSVDTCVPRPGGQNPRPRSRRRTGVTAESPPRTSLHPPPCSASRATNQQPTT